MATPQAGGIIVWRDRVVLRRTILGEWVFPKGWIDPGETPEQAAIREAREETGIQAQIVRTVGNASYQADGEDRDVAYFLMRVVDSPEWVEHAGIDAASFPVDEVASVLSFDNIRELWDRALPDVRHLIRNRRGWT
jgi:diadenosine hexaphosphate hydrolase (ATP-forming)